jgi:hypothetical protein
LCGHTVEWSDIKQGLKSLQQVTFQEDGKLLAIRNGRWNVSFSEPFLEGVPLEIEKKEGPM